MNQHRRLILWFRNDLRLHDNAALSYAQSFAKHNQVEIVPVFVFDPRFFTQNVPEYGIQKCGPHRLKFTIEAVQNLRQNLRKIGSNLLVSDLKAELFLKQIATQNCMVVYQQETCSEEQAVERAVKQLGLGMTPVWNSTLLHVDDLPQMNKFPNSYTQFR